MDGIAVSTQNRALWEELPQNAQSAFGKDTRETNEGGGMRPERFIDDGFQIGESFDDFRGCDQVVVAFCGCVKLALQL